MVRYGMGTYCFDVSCMKLRSSGKEGETRMSVHYVLGEEEVWAEVT